MDFTITKDNSGLQQALFRVTHGLYILTAARDGRLNGQCLDALMQVTAVPPRIAIGLGRRSLTHEMITATGLFVVNVLNREDPTRFEKIKHFGLQSGRQVEKFKDTPYELGENGAPIIPDALAFFECRVVPEMTGNLDTHTLFVANVTRAGYGPEGEPLTYAEYRKRTKK